jgi:DNA polymerase-3 subunit chi
MTQVDFYVLPDNTSEARWLFACRLIEKVYKMGMDILVSLDNAEQAQAFDQLLWTFKPESFIPHQVIDGKHPAAVQITFTEEAGDHHGLLLNLSSNIPSWFSRFERVSEIVIQEENALKTSRERFSFYKGRGYPIETRKL